MGLVFNKFDYIVPTNSDRLGQNILNLLVIFRNAILVKVENLVEARSVTQDYLGFVLVAPCEISDFFC